MLLVREKSLILVSFIHAGEHILVCLTIQSEVNPKRKL